ncbi:MAG: phosphatase PAP2 family protein, partial [Nitrospirota bacterium]
MDYLIELDKTFFFFINIQIQNTLFDIIMPYITEKKNMLPYLIAIAALLVLRGGKRGREAVVLLLLAVIISDQLSNLLKGIFQRVRPCSALDGVRLLAGCGSSFSLPSNHATNAFSMAIVGSLIYNRFTPLLMFFAFAVAFSRIYVGVHYPFDVALGALVGIFVGYVITTAYDILKKSREKTDIQNQTETKEQ